MPQLNMIQQICIWALPVILAITFHEAAHAYIAYRCGDTTAKMLGRLSLNPLRHVDPLGTLLIPILIGVLTQFSFVIGYAKPVPINWQQLHKPKRDMILVALAGPASNLIMAFLWALCFKIATHLHPEHSMPGLFLIMTARAGMLINLVLIALNLLPLPPLDGSRVVSCLLSPRKAMIYEKVEPYGFFILIFLMFTGILNSIMAPIINIGFYILSYIFQL